MARVVVIGGGLAGMASAARLAKLGHDVTLLEARPELGGALGTIERDGFAWDAGASTTTMPAVLRDLFRKSGRPLERELDLTELPTTREHRFRDGTRLTLPTTGRAAVRDAVDAGLGDGNGERWLEWTAGFADVWETLRRGLLERRYDLGTAPKTVTSLLRDKATLHQAVGRLRDERLRTVALHHAASGGHDPRKVPWWMGFLDYVEQRFGMWTVPGGLGRLTGVLDKRLAERGVTVHTDTTVTDLAVDAGTCVGVRIEDETVEADHVVVATDPRRLPALAKRVAKTMPALPPTVVHVGLDAPYEGLPHEVVLHGDVTITLDTTGRAAEGRSAWTLSARGRLTEDLLDTMARRGVDIRDSVAVRVDRSPQQQVTELGGSAYGVLWQGRATPRDQLLTVTPYDNVVAAGVHTTVSALTPFVGLTAALAAEAIGPA